MSGYKSENMEVEIKVISPESFLNLIFQNCLISDLTQFKTF